MGDLISREDLLGTQRLLMTDIVENNPAAKFVLEQVLFDIEHAETAFDKEKVIAKLEEAGQECCEANDICGAEAIDYAIEVVEEGGIE